jgi:polar amino acid transport system substrate-binding protein
MWKPFGRAIILLLPIAAFLVSMTTAGPQTRNLRLASTEWSPFTNDQGKARFALELVQTALDRAGIDSNTTIVDEGRLTPALLSGEFDGSAALWKDEARERALFYSQPYLENRLILVGRKGSDVSAKALVELAGKRLALVEGYAYGDKVTSPNGPIIVPSDNEEDSLEKLLDHDADYTLMDELVVEYILKNYATEAQSRLDFGSTPLIVRTLHLAINRTLPGAQKMIDLFNAEVLSMIADRSYHRLLRLDWLSADVDGDGVEEYVPRDDQPGPNPPEHSYKLFAGQTPSGPVASPHFYLGGKVYPNWVSVPESYKHPRPAGASIGTEISIFTFRW